MRKPSKPQIPLMESSRRYKHGRELQAMSDILDAEPRIVQLVHADLVRGGVDPGKGREGMTAEQVIRSLIVKQLNGYSYEELAYRLSDSRGCGAFCRFGIVDETPKKSTLQRNIKCIKAETMEAINVLIIQYACQKGIERGRKLRVDCTVVESNIHKPTDSSLLWDCVRVLDRIMGEAKETFGLNYTDHSRRAKRRAIGILNAGKESKRVKLYKDLLKVTRKTVAEADSIASVLELYRSDELLAEALARELAKQLHHFIELARKVIDQTERRLLHGQKVPAGEKVFSIFEPHTDIIIKDRRDKQYGHKICLSSGASRLITDCVVEDGNPADSTLAVKMVKRQEGIYGRPPRQASFDGGFTSRDNLHQIKKLGVEDVCFSKKRGLKVSDMVKSLWVYKRLRNFRAGIEGMISFLKRCFGLNRCMWKGHQSFKAYVQASVATMNLLLVARHMMA